MMRWNCPHCGVQLAASDEQLSPDWSFSRCCQCGGFALIRRPNIELIRTGEPPATETYIETSSLQVPAFVKPQPTATHAKPVIRPAATRIPPPTPPAFNYTMENFAQPLPVMQEIQEPAPVQRAAVAKAAPLPEPLPSAPPKISRKSRVPQVLTALSLVAVVSGVFLYDQSERVSRSSSRMTYPFPTDRVPEPAPAAPIQAAMQPAPMIDQIEQKAMAPERAPEPIVVQTQTQEPAVAEPQTTINSAPTLVEGKQTVSVTIRDREVNLRTGPGLTYPVIGKAQEGETFQVIDWEDQWLKVQVDDPKVAASDTAWLKKNRANLVLKNNPIALTH